MMIITAVANDNDRRGAAIIVLLEWPTEPIFGGFFQEEDSLFFFRPETPHVLRLRPRGVIGYWLY
jgi:hypothetical protein